jgi:hypothetical protein
MPKRGREETKGSKGKKATKAAKASNPNPDDIKVPKDVWDSLAKRHPKAKKSQLQKHLQSNIDLLIDVYSDEQENHVWLFEEPEREAALVISKNELLPPEAMARMLEDIERNEEFKAELDDVSKEALKLFPTLMTECLTDVSLQEFKEAIDIITKKYSLKTCKRLTQMTQTALKLVKDNILTGNAKDHGDFEINIISDVLRMFFGATIGREMAIARLEAILEFLG